MCKNCTKMHIFCTGIFAPFFCGVLSVKRRHGCFLGAKNVHILHIFVHKFAHFFAPRKFRCFHPMMRIFGQKMDIFGKFLCTKMSRDPEKITIFWQNSHSAVSRQKPLFPEFEFVKYPKFPKITKMTTAEMTWIFKRYAQKKPFFSWILCHFLTKNGHIADPRKPQICTFCIFGILGGIFHPEIRRLHLIIENPCVYFGG